MTGIVLAELKALVVVPALAAIELPGDAVNLVTGTAIVESGAAHLEQIDGPARGLWQMEPATEDDIWAHWLSCNPREAAVVNAIRGGYAPGNAMTWNLLYGALMCRIKYWRWREALPDPADAGALAAYWKTIYNSPRGAGVVDAAHIAAFQMGIDA